MISRIHVAAMMLPLLAIDACMALAEDWPMLGRDRTRNPVSLEKNAPVWRRSGWADGSESKAAGNIQWSVKLGTRTASDPVIAGGMIWIGTSETDAKTQHRSAVLNCLREKDGKLLYQYRSPPQPGAAYRDLERAAAGHTSSPLVEGDRIWFTTTRCETVCLDIGPLRRGEGQPKELWKVDMVRQLGIFPSDAPMGYGKTCSIAASCKGRIFVCTGNGVDPDGNVPQPKAPSLVCFAKDTGKVLWTDDSPGAKIREGQWSSPLVLEIQGRDQVIVPQGDGWLRSFDAETGALIWKFDTNPRSITDPIDRAQLLATPVYCEGRIYNGNGASPVCPNPPKSTYFYCIDPTRLGDISPEIEDAKGKIEANPNSGMIWRHGGREGKRWIFLGTMASAAVCDGLALVAETSGYLTCLDARTGKLQWRFDAGVDMIAAPLVLDGKILIGTQDGNVHVLSLAREQVVRRSVDMDGGIAVSPVFANGVLYVATHDSLFALAGQEQAPAAAKASNAGYWPQWRGPDRTNVARDTGLLKSWPKEGPPLIWTAKGLGSGVPSLSVAGGRIFTLGNHDEQEHLVALAEDGGKVLWKTPIGPAIKSAGVMQWLSQRTPTVDGDRVYGVSARGILSCCEVDTGKELWRKDYAKDFDGKIGAWGFCDFPLVDGDRLICTPGGDMATLVALDKKTGAVVWQCPIPGQRSTYGGLIRAEIDGVPMYIHQLDGGIFGVSPAGKLLWKVEVQKTSMGNVHTALIRDDLVFFSCGWGVKGSLLRVRPNKDVVETEAIYANSQSLESWLGSSVLAGDFVHTSSGQRIEWKTGKTIERLRIQPRSTMTYADGRLVHRDGGTGVVMLHEVTPDGYVKRGEFAPPAADKADKPAKAVSTPPWTFPVIAGGRLYLRDQNVLFCYDLRDQKKSSRREPDAIFVPTPQDIVEKMLTLARVQKSDFVCDLGCGDGRIVVAAAKKYGCKALGVDLDPECVRLARDTVAKEGVAALVTIEEKDLFAVDLTRMDVVALYLLPKLNVKLLPQLEKLKPGARIVSHEFPIDGFEPDQVLRHMSSEDGVEHRLYLWTTPLKKTTNK